MRLLQESGLPLGAAARTIVLPEPPTGGSGGVLGPPDQGREFVRRLHDGPRLAGPSGRLTTIFALWNAARRFRLAPVGVTSILLSAASGHPLVPSLNEAT